MSDNQKQLITQLTNGSELLPIVQHAEQIKEGIIKNDRLMVIGETGSGKTTEVPSMILDLMDKGLLPQGKIAITQPRRPAAITVAEYVAKKRGSQVGGEVGYQISRDKQVNEGTRANFMTDGILLEKLKYDPLLQEFSVVMVDEAHERSLNIDFLLGLLKRAQTERANRGLPPLKIIVTSATLEKEKFQRYFGEYDSEKKDFKDAPTVEVPGRLFEVKTFYEETRPYNYFKAAADRAKQIINEINTKEKPDGDILVFMPGQDEIISTIEELKKARLTDKVEILELQGKTSVEEQKRALRQRPAGGKPRIIVCTNVAETSVTVPGVRYVIDSGLIKQTQYDSQTGIEALVTIPHAQSGCKQRMGRAGRTAPGECYRLYTEKDFQERQPYQIPEIQRSNLAHVVLIMKKMGIENIRQFDFIDPPKKDEFESTFAILKKLGALNENEDLTDIGRFMAELHLKPELSRMIIEADKNGCVEEAIIIAAMLKGKEVFIFPKDENKDEEEDKNEKKDKKKEAEMAHRRFKTSGSDVIALLTVFKEYFSLKQNLRNSWAHQNWVNAQALQEILEVRKELLSVVEGKTLNGHSIKLTSSKDPDAIGMSVTSGYIWNLLEASTGHSYRRLEDELEGIYIFPGSASFGNDPQLLVTLKIAKTSKTFARVCQPVKLKWILDAAPQIVIRQPIGLLAFNPETGLVESTYSILLKNSRISIGNETRNLSKEEPDKAVPIFAKALADEQIPQESSQAIYKLEQNNKKTIKVINDLYERAIGQVFKQPLFIILPITATQLGKWYQLRLGKICTVEELNHALQNSEIDLTIKIEDFFKEGSADEIIDKINILNPLEIKVGEQVFPVEYKDNNISGFGSSKPSVIIYIDPAIALTLQDLPRHPNSDRTEFIYKVGIPIVKPPIMPTPPKSLFGSRPFADSKYIASTFGSPWQGFSLNATNETTLKEFLEAYKKYLRDQIWSKSKPATIQIKLEDLDEKLKPIEIGKVADEPIMAYPVFKRISFFSLNGFYEIFYQSEKPENNGKEDALKQLEQEKIEKAKEQEEISRLKDLINKYIEIIKSNVAKYGMTADDVSGNYNSMQSKVENALRYITSNPDVCKRELNSLLESLLRNFVYVLANKLFDSMSWLNSKDDAYRNYETRLLNKSTWGRKPIDLRLEAHYRINDDEKADLPEDLEKDFFTLYKAIDKTGKIIAELRLKTERKSTGIFNVGNPSYVYFELIDKDSSELYDPDNIEIVKVEYPKKEIRVEVPSESLKPHLVFNIPATTSTVLTEEAPIQPEVKISESVSVEYVTELRSDISSLAKYIKDRNRNKSISEFVDLAMFNFAAADANELGLIKIRLSRLALDTGINIVNYKSDSQNVTPAIDINTTPNKSIESAERALGVWNETASMTTDELVEQVKLLRAGKQADHLRKNLFYARLASRPVLELINIKIPGIRDVIDLFDQGIASLKKQAANQFILKQAVPDVEKNIRLFENIRNELTALPDIIDKIINTPSVKGLIEDESIIEQFKNFLSVFLKNNYIFKNDFLSIQDLNMLADSALDAFTSKDEP